MVERVTDGLWHVDCRTRDMPNVYVVEDGDTTLVDAGWPGDIETVRTAFDEMGVELQDVDRILLTHYDADHVGTLARLTPELDAPVFVHRDEAPYVAGDRLPPWTARRGLEALHRLYYRRLDLPDLPVRHVGDGDEIGGFRAYHTPGHTPGHTVYLHEDTAALFLGDLVYRFGDDLRPSGWITSYDARQVEGSIRRLVERLPEFEHACPGHGDPLVGGSNHLAQAVE